VRAPPLPKVPQRGLTDKRDVRRGTFGREYATPISALPAPRAIILGRPLRCEAYRGAVSLPFAPGEHRRIAVKIVDDRSIERIKVLEVER
jgi:hypothetical protein